MEENYNKIYKPGDYKNNKINAIIEIPTGSTEKIEWNRATCKFDIDRKEPSLFPEPANYGFIPQTTSGDGDNLDVIILSNEPISTGSVIEADVIGIMKFIDNHDVDDKIIAVQSGNKSVVLSDIIKGQLDSYFSHYKDYIRPGMTDVLGWGGAEEAGVVIENSVKLFTGRSNK